MKARFEWHDEEGELEPSPDVTKDSRFPFRPIQSFIGLLVLLISIAIPILLIHQQQEKAVANVEQQVLGSFNLWWEAMMRSDQELLNSLFSSGDRNWRRKQKLLADNTLFSNWVPISSDSYAINSAPSVELSPDLTLAEVNFPIEYLVKTSPTFSQTVALEHTAFYRRYDNQWIQVPPQDKYWGDTQSIEYPLVTLVYPQRDAELAKRIAKDLDEKLAALCTDGMGKAEDNNCQLEQKVFLDLSTETSSVEKLASQAEMLRLDNRYTLPAPTLIGWPVNENSYPLFFDAYTQKLQKSYISNLPSPVTLPEQKLKTLCFDYPSIGLKLFTYDPTHSSWVGDESDRSYSYLEALADDSGILLQESDGITEESRAGYFLREATEEILFADESIDLIPWRPIGLLGSANAQKLLLQQTDPNLAFNNYGWLDLNLCRQQLCNRVDVPGFPVWSPNGQNLLIFEGSEIYIFDGELNRQVGNGFNPFWFNDRQFGFIRFVRQGEQQITEVVRGSPETHNLEVLFSSLNLAQAVDSTEIDTLIINFVAVNPGLENQLVVSATGIRKNAGEYFILTVDLPTINLMNVEEAIELQLWRDGAPAGAPGILSPTGYPPFVVSPDGRWLVINEHPNIENNAWTTLLHDLKRNETAMIFDTLPAFPAKFPSYDWSSDGRWLVIADDGFMRLIAPNDAYEKLILHNFDSCRIAVWSD